MERRRELLEKFLSGEVIKFTNYQTGPFSSIALSAFISRLQYLLLSNKILLFYILSDVAS